MTRVRSVVCAVLVVTMLATAADPLQAEDQPIIKLMLHPSAQPKPALKYLLLPGRLDQIPGNAAVYYGKVTAEEISFFSNREMRENIKRWQETPLEELRRDPVRLPIDGNIADSIRRGSRSKYCDWQLPIGDVPFYGMLLPEVQQIREFGRILGARARMQVAHGEFNDAVESLQTGYALARHTATGETLVNGLVGIAICEIMSRQVIDFVQQPESPNLYWALTMLPSPLIEMRDAIDVEAMSVELSFPEIRDLERAEHTADEWKELFHHFAKQFLEQASNSDSPQPPSPEKLEELCREMLPTARQSIIVEGIPKATVEAMPDHQVALIYSLRTYHDLLDEGIKCYFLPYPRANAGIEAAIERAKRDQREIIPLAERLLPALRATRNATARNDRRIAVLRVIESLRIYGASHDGRLPETLDDISEVPVPDDPVTGKPFVYRVEGEKAILQGPTIGFSSLDYEISMVRP